MQQCWPSSVGTISEGVIVRMNNIDLKIYLEVREGPRNGLLSHYEAYEAAKAVKTGELSANCYLENIRGPYFM